MLRAHQSPPLFSASMAVLEIQQKWCVFVAYMHTSIRTSMHPFLSYLLLYIHVRTASSKFHHEKQAQKVCDKCYEHLVENDPNCIVRVIPCLFEGKDNLTREALNEVHELLALGKLLLLCIVNMLLSFATIIENIACYYYSHD